MLVDTMYINRKGTYSINVQMIYDADITITNIVTGWHGSTHVSRILGNSRIAEGVSNLPVRGYLLRDGGHDCSRYLMTPLRNPRTPAE